MLLKSRWANPMAHALRFDEHVRNAEMLARRLSGVEDPAEFVWLNAVTVEDCADIEEVLGILDEHNPDAQEVVMADLLADELCYDRDNEPPPRQPESPTVLDPMDDINSKPMAVQSLLAACQDLNENNDSDTDISVVEATMDIEVSTPPPHPAPVSTVVEWSEVVRL